MLEALKAALTSWPRVELVRIERRWRGLEAVEGIVAVVDVVLDLVVVGVLEVLGGAVAEWEVLKTWRSWGSVCGEAKVFYMWFAERNL